MARAYATDLRERAVRAAWAGHLTRSEGAEQFDISEGTRYGWLRRRKEEGSVEPLPHGGGRQPSRNAEGMRHLREMVRQQNDGTLASTRSGSRRRPGCR
jgi:transposase